MWTLFFSLLLLSYIVVPIRESANTLNPFILKSHNNLCNLFKWYAMNMETDFPRGCTTSPSLNSSKKTFVNFTTLSIDYVNWVQAQADNMTQAEQVENGESKGPFLSYAILKEITPNIVSM